MPSLTIFFLLTLSWGVKLLSDLIEPKAVQISS